MRFEILIATLLGVACTSGNALAEVSVAGREVPRFTQQERETIRRNELLKAIVESDPWTVRCVLDLTIRKPKTSHDGADPAGSPRTAAGSLDCIALLEAARDRKQDRATPSVGRSAEESVRLVDLLKAAGERKQRDGKAAPSEP